MLTIRTLAFSTAARNLSRYAGSVLSKCCANGSIPCTPNFSTTSAGNWVRGNPASLVLRERLPGALINARNGYDATAMRSRGAVGKSMCGLPWGEAAKSDPGVEPAIMLPAAKVESVSRNERRVCEFIIVYSPEVRTGFYDAGWLAQSSFKNATRRA